MLVESTHAGGGLQDVGTSGLMPGHSSSRAARSDQTTENMAINDAAYGEIPSKDLTDDVNFGLQSLHEIAMIGDTPRPIP